MVRNSEVKVKICGLTTPDAVKAAVDFGADYVGCVFYRLSPRYIAPKDAAKIMVKLPKHIKKVAVVVDMSLPELTQMVRLFKPDYIQLHGRENEADILRVKEALDIPVIKAVRVSSSDDIAKAMRFRGIADMLLFDAKAPNSLMPGGNGLVFDWTLLRARQIEIPWFLSGGLNLQNITDALYISGAKMVDLSSSLEVVPGIKDPELIMSFLKKVKQP